MYIPLLFQDDNLLVINKPAGIVLHTDSGFDEGTDVVSLLKSQLNLTYLGIHQRLDREVSGVVVFATRPQSNEKLARIFEGREVHKEYLAVVSGRTPAKRGLIEAPLIERNGKWQVASPGTPGAKPARTRYRVELQAKNYALLRLTLETGRTHQLRVHLAHLGCPIIGDPLNSINPLKKVKNREGGFFPRLLLHAVKLSIPGTEGFTFEAPPPFIFEKAAQGKEIPELFLASRLENSSISTLQPPDRAGLLGLLELAQARRLPFISAPGEENTAFRLVNGAGDGLPGITLDRLGNSLVLNCYDPVLEAGHPALKLLLETLTLNWKNYPVYVKFRPRLSSRLGEAAPPEVAPSHPQAGPEQQPETFTVKENNLNFITRPGEGLSPGLFLDMREIRAWLRDRAEGKTILNCFSYTCGFGVAAQAGRAARVLNLDSARRALEWGKENYRANAFEPADFDFVSGDVFDWLERFARRNQIFEVVILDPPSFSTTQKTRWSAEKDYDRLVEKAARVTAPGGLLLACTNHAGLSRRTFRQLVTQGLERSNREGVVERVFHEPGLDFPVRKEEENYLKILALRLK